MYIIQESNDPMCRHLVCDPMTLVDVPYVTYFDGEIRRADSCVVMEMRRLCEVVKWLERDYISPKTQSSDSLQIFLKFVRYSLYSIQQFCLLNVH